MASAVSCMTGGGGGCGGNLGESGSIQLPSGDAGDALALGPLL